MFRGFNGEYRRRPAVSIGGASANKKETKEQFVKRVQEERKRRQDDRLRTESSTRIQKFFRGHLGRVRCRHRWRQEFDELRQTSAGKLDSLEAAEPLAVRIGFFFSPSLDRERLVWLCSKCVMLKERLLKELSESCSLWRFRVCRLMELCLRFFATLTKEDNLGPLLRVFELANESSPLFVRQLVLGQNDYFGALRVLCDSRIPPPLEETEVAQTPMAEAIAVMLLRPFAHVSDKDDVEYRRHMRKNLCHSFFSRPFSPQVRLFILPFLAHSQYSVDAYVSLEDVDHSCQSSPWLLFSYLKIAQANINRADDLLVSEHIKVLSFLSRELSKGGCCANTDDEDEDEDDQGDVGPKLFSNVSPDVQSVLVDSVELLNSSSVVSRLSAVAESSSDPSVLSSLFHVCHDLLLSEKMAIHRYRLLHTLAFRPTVIQRAWNFILNAKQEVTHGKPISLVTVLSKGLPLSSAEQSRLVPLVAVFSSLLGYLLVTVHDTEFYGGGDWMPFRLRELPPMSLVLRDLALGLVQLAFPESRPTVRPDYQKVVPESAQQQEKQTTKLWGHLFNKVVKLVHQLYARDTRRQYCPDGHWICSDIVLPVDRANQFSFRRSGVRQYRPFQSFRVFTRQELEEEGPPLSTKEIRLATILRELPYAIAFPQRVIVFSNLVSKDKEENQPDRVQYMQGTSINITVRRTYIYEDSFEKLSPENEPNLRYKMRVQLKNPAGLEEAGIDGGGLFREFLTELLKTAFDPNRGFFRITTDQQLYPNPSVQKIESKFIPHYFFIGRMLGKAIYESHLVELPLASFFLSKLLGQVNADIDHLSSLDPELYKNLLYLKNYEGNVQGLGLDFTIVNEEVGQTTVDELKPGGAEIPVTELNRIEYIHLVADYKLNKQIRAQCNAFREGLSDVINLDWLHMFSYRELQTLISGSESAIDLDDLMAHCNYSNGFSIDHQTIQDFWQVVRKMSEQDKRALLKFVTSCSRPPLFGFKELIPPFCIQNAGDDESRLPTASTCMNLLKLPQFKDKDTLRTKLLYAIKSGAGFELS